MAGGYGGGRGRKKIGALHFPPASSSASSYTPPPAPLPILLLPDGGSTKVMYYLFMFLVSFPIVMKIGSLVAIIPFSS